ncbi:hypothetical protein ACFLU6_08580 [Acidobacteriota bacterium]
MSASGQDRSGSKKIPSASGKEPKRGSIPPIQIPQKGNVQPAVQDALDELGLTLEDLEVFGEDVLSTDLFDNVNTEAAKKLFESDGALNVQTLVSLLKKGDKDH